MALSLATIGLPIKAALFNAVVNLLNNPNQTIMQVGGSVATVAATTGFSAYSGVILNATGWYSGTNPSRFTPTISGIYEFNVNVGFGANATGVRVWQLKKNGTTVLLEDRLDNPDASNGAARSLTVHLTMNGTTDYLEFWYLQNSTVSLGTLGTVSLKLVK